MYFVDSGRQLLGAPFVVTNRTRLQTESVLDLFQNPFITMPLSSVSQGDRVTLQTLPAHPVLVQRLRALGV
jgi:hypothetical protein